MHRLTIDGANDVLIISEYRVNNLFNIDGESFMCCVYKLYVYIR